MVLVEATSSSLIVFPCKFLLKVVGVNSSELIQGVSNIVYKYFPNTTQDGISYRKSSAKRYIGLSITIYATDKATLDGLYQELTVFPGVKMVL